MAITSNDILPNTLTTSTSIAAMPLTGEKYVFFQFTGTFAGITAVIEATVDSVNWFSIPVFSLANNYPLLGTLTPVAGVAWFTQVLTLYTQVRVRATAYASGTATVNMLNGPAINGVVTASTVAYNASNVAKLTAPVAAGTTTVDFPLVASGPGILHRLIITSTATTVYTISDNPTVSSGAPLLYGSDTTSVVGNIIELDVPFTNGLVVGKTNGSAAFTAAYTLY